jgi:hypothetical protein
MYDRLAFRHKYLVPVNAETLTAVVSPVGEKACILARTPWILAYKNPATAVNKRRVGNLSQLGKSLAIVATAVGVLRAPETINYLPEEWEQFTHSTQHVVTIATNNVVDLSLEFVTILRICQARANDDEYQPRTRQPKMLG